MSRINALAPVTARLISGFMLIALCALPLAAAQPSSGSIDVTTTNPITWVGTAPGGSSPDAENTCVEGVNCETFTITLNGTVGGQPLPSPQHMMTVWHQHKSGWMVIAHSAAM